jgi:hypothetical protein
MKNPKIEFEDTGEVKLYVRSMGKMLRITAAFTDTDKTNDYLAKHDDQGVVAEIESTILIANLYDKGI